MPDAPHPTEEHARRATSSYSDAGPWKQWGPYLSERAWGTVREDYSAGGTAWEYFPHDHARSRAYRWSEDGLAGICDLRQRLCFAFAFWNGADAILKERLFGLTGNEGNHGEDVKELWWYLDNTPTHSWMRWRYHYPQAAFPYEDLVRESERRSGDDREYELTDTSAFDDDRYWEITVDYAKASPEDICVVVRIRNAGPDTATLHVLPTLWFRNTWSWSADETKPVMRVGSENMRDPTIVAERSDGPATVLTLGPSPIDASPPRLLFCDNETNARRLFGTANSHEHPKDAINDSVVTGVPHTNPAQRGTKAAAHYQLTIGSGETTELRVRLCAATQPSEPSDVRDGHTRTCARRETEADEFYAHLLPESCTADEKRIVRQACAGMLWSKQFFHFDVSRWLDGDPAQPAPHRNFERNSGWRHLYATDVISMPDAWEYPWFAAWDLAFHCVAIAHLDPAFAKQQLTLLCREWYMHPNGQLPAYEWAFGDVNPPVHAWAALRVFEIDGCRDIDFLARVFHKLLINFTWWVNRTDSEGNNLFEGGFLGLDNIGVFNRARPLPDGSFLEQSDATAWMAMYCTNLLEIALILANDNRSYEDVALKFFEHFAVIATAINNAGMWDETDGFFYDLLRQPDGSTMPIRARSIVGVVAMFAALVIEPGLVANLHEFRRRAGWFIGNRSEVAGPVSHLVDERMGAGSPLLLSVLDEARLRRLLSRVLDPDEFLSPYGLRSLSRVHRDAPLDVQVGDTRATLGYEPAESRSGFFGGNSNWRGPVWMPVNHLAVEALRTFHRGLGPDFTVEHPLGSGVPRTLAEVADDLSMRLMSLFKDGADGLRPCFGSNRCLQHDRARHDLLLFHEYFHGDTGEGLGASHQTGWTGLVIDLMLRGRA